MLRGLAEREGFEPSMQVTPHGGLANRCTRPLCDLSVATAAGILPWASRRSGTSGPGRRPAKPRDQEVRESRRRDPRRHDRRARARRRTDPSRRIRPGVARAHQREAADQVDPGRSRPAARARGFDLGPRARREADHRHRARRRRLSRTSRRTAPSMEAAGYVLRIREADWFEHRLFKGPDTEINLARFQRRLPGDRADGGVP